MVRHTTTAFTGTTFHPPYQQVSEGVCLMSYHECVDVTTDIECSHVLFGIYIEERYLTNLRKKKVAFLSLSSTDWTQLSCLAAASLNRMVLTSDPVMQNCRPSILSHHTTQVGDAVSKKNSNKKSQYSNFKLMITLAIFYICTLHAPYSGKLSREKTFTDQ